MAPLRTIEGIGPVHVKEFAKINIVTTEGLLEAAGSPSGRRDISKTIGMSEHMLLKHVNRADLMRVKGVAGQYSDLLEAAGVDTVKELKHRVPANLHAKMEKVNSEKNCCRRVPTLPAVKKWVAHAKRLKAAIEY